METYLLKYIKQSKNLCYFYYKKENREFWIPKIGTEIENENINKLIEGHFYGVKISYKIAELKGLL